MVLETQDLLISLVEGRIVRLRGVKRYEGRGLKNMFDHTVSNGGLWHNSKQGAIYKGAQDTIIFQKQSGLCLSTRVRVQLSSRH